VAEKTKRPTREVIQQWIKDVNKGGRGLTDWELHFMESITDQFESVRGLSEKQEEILERIYTEKVK
jgi:hypothetical protein